MSFPKGSHSLCAGNSLQKWRNLVIDASRLWYPNLLFFLLKGLNIKDQFDREKLIWSLSASYLYTQSKMTTEGGNNLGRYKFPARTITLGKIQIFWLSIKAIHIGWRAISTAFAKCCGSVYFESQPSLICKYGMMMVNIDLSSPVWITQDIFLSNFGYERPHLFKERE